MDFERRQKTSNEEVDSAGLDAAEISRPFFTRIVANSIGLSRRNV
ncbi:TPA: hypothetical protein ACK3Q6_008278 [Burkholderia cepacia]|nr:hypothetical protein [Burkholderia cepacia]